VKVKTLAVGELKSHFSDVLNEVKHGRPVAVGYGKRKTKVAVIVSYEQYKRGAERRLGVMEGRASYTVRKDFKMSDEEILES
jgi:prevent-host-death family protein